MPRPDRSSTRARISIDDWTHLSSITVADGSVYVTTRKTIVYAFGLNK